MVFSGSVRAAMGSRFRRSMALAMSCLLTACAAVPARNPLASWVPSPNHGERRAQLIVLHYTDEPSVQKSLEILQSSNSGGPVSAHYLISADGVIYQLVADAQRAWHAGPGRWGTITDVNSASIGIELDNDSQSPFSPAQINSLLVLLADLTNRLNIPRTQIIGHEDFAPTRKRDPGPLFPWQQLANAGFGLWPQGPLIDPPDGFDPWLALRAIGYPPDDRVAVVRAFHHHYRGIEGDTLDNDDLRVLYALSRQLSSPISSPLPSTAADGVEPPGRVVN